jgi:hypothetical protein
MSDQGCHDLPALCPHCGRPTEHAGSVTHPRPPQDGDLVMCFYCLEVGVYRQFMSTLVWSKLTVEEAAHVDEAHPEVARLRAHLLTMDREP